jgi:hypothetical protein
MELKSLTQRIKCVGAESGCLSMLREYLVSCSMRLGVPFIAPMQLGAVEDHFGRHFLPSVEWCTGQPGAQPDSHCSSPVRDLLPNQTHPTVAPRGWLAHRTLSGVHRTVRCTQSTVGASHVSRADRADDRWRWRSWLTRQSGAPSDNPVNFSRTPLLFSQEQLVHRRPAWRTEHCPVHHRTVRCAWPELMLAAHSQSFSKFVSLFSAMFPALGHTC